MHACMLNCVSHVRLFANLWTVARQAPLPKGFSRQECWSGLLYSSPWNLPEPGIEPTSLMSAALAGEFFTTSATWAGKMVEVKALLEWIQDTVGKMLRGDSKYRSFLPSSVIVL